MKLKSFTILVVDDDESDRVLITRALRQNGVTDPIHCVSSGDEAIAYLNGEGEYANRSAFAYPSFIMIDLKMPHGDGFLVLEHLKSVPERASVPTIAFSGSADRDDIHNAYLMGAASYLVKPLDSDELQKLLKTCHDYWMECEIPEVDINGRKLKTVSGGKLGERLFQPSPRASITKEEKVCTPSEKIPSSPGSDTKILLNITKRRLAEMALEASEQRYKRL